MPSKPRSHADASPRQIARASRSYDAPFGPRQLRRSEWEGPVKMEGKPVKNFLYACTLLLQHNRSGGFAGRTVQTPLGEKIIERATTKRVYFREGGVGKLEGPKGHKDGLYSLFIEAPEHFKPEAGTYHAGFLEAHDSPESLIGRTVRLKLRNLEIEKQIVEAAAKSVENGARVTRLKFHDRTFGRAFELADGRFSLFVRSHKDK